MASVSRLVGVCRSSSHAAQCRWLSSVPRLTFRGSVYSGCVSAGGLPTGGLSAGGLSLSQPTRCKRLSTGPRLPPPGGLSLPQRAFLGAGAAVLSLLNPYRGDLVAVLSETTGELPLAVMRYRMAQSVEGRQLLEQRPRISSESLGFNNLAQLPHNTLGFQYHAFMSSRGYQPEGRLPVRFVGDPELAFVLQRYRDVHDLWHVLLGLPTSVLGELAQKVECCTRGLWLVAHLDACVVCSVCSAVV